MKTRLIVALGLAVATAPAARPPQVCYRFDRPHFTYRDPMSARRDSTDIIAFDQAVDTMSAAPFGAPEGALAIDVPLMKAHPHMAAQAIDRSWWRRLGTDSVVLNWYDVIQGLTFTFVSRGDSLVGSVNQTVTRPHLAPGRPAPAHAVRVRCPAPVRRPGLGGTGISDEGEDKVIHWILDGSMMVGAVIMRGASTKRPLSAAEGAARRRRADSLQKVAAARRWSFGSIAGTFVAYDPGERTVHAEGRSFMLPERRAILAVLIDLKDSVGGRPRIVTRQIKVVSSATPPKRTAEGEELDGAALDRVLRLDAFVKAFLDRQ
jgi:hypothetical protein